MNCIAKYRDMPPTFPRSANNPTALANARKMTFAIKNTRKQKAFPSIVFSERNLKHCVH